ncbi:MAG TPA: GNAT family N-acetyltransferase [Nitrososphaeraceae archaeon]
MRKSGDYVFYRCGQGNLSSVIEINLNSLPEHYTEYFFESILKELPEAFIVAEFEGNIIGYVMCKVEFGFSNFRKLGFVKKGHVVSIAVLEQHRGKKVGTILMEEAMNGLVARRTEEVYLEVRVSNYAAIKMYEKLNFKVKSRLKSYYRDGEDAYLMALELL